MQNYHFKVLKNPKTQNYLDLKDWVLSENFLWAYHETSTPRIEEEPMGKGQHINVPYYTHTFLLRPETNRYSSLYHSSPEDLQRVIRSLMKLPKQTMLNLHRMLESRQMQFIPINLDLTRSHT